MSKNFDEIKASYNMISEIKDIKENPVTEAMISLVKEVPFVGELVDSSANKVINEFQEKKQSELIECILKKREYITTEQVNDVEFIINFTRTVEAVKRLATNDKVKYFGNLIRNGYLSGHKIEEYVFEEYFDIINSLSIREIQYITAYKQYCEANTKPNKKVVYSMFGKFLKDYAKETGVDARSIYVVFSRLVKTGFVDELFETETGQIEYDNDIPNLLVEGNDYAIDKSFLEFYDMVLKMDI